MQRLWALMSALISPVSPRENSVSGMHCERPPPAAEPCVLHGEQVVAGGDAGTAVGHRMLRRRVAEDGPEALPELLAGLEGPVRSEVFLEGRAHRPRNVARHRVERFDLAAVALSGPRVDERG